MSSRGLGSFPDCPHNRMGSCRPGDSGHFQVLRDWLEMTKGHQGGWCLGNPKGHSVSHKGSHTFNFDFGSDCIYFLKQTLCSHKTKLKRYKRFFSKISLPALPPRSLPAPLPEGNAATSL